MHETKTEDLYENFSKNKETLVFNNYSTKTKGYDNSNKLVAGKMKNKTGGVANQELIGLKPNMCFFADYSSEHKTSKAVNKNVVATITYNEYKYVLLNKKYLRHLMNKIQSKDLRIRT